jgi:hypothetical protein
MKQILKLKIVLRDLKPAIWRRIEVPADYNFWDLHVAIQDAMGWLDTHLHVFRIPLRGGKEIEIGIPDPDNPQDPMAPGWIVPVKGIFPLELPVEYLYDFGDGWSHEITLESVGPRAKGAKYPRCVGGARVGPPEDCGGPPGYQDILEVLARPGDPEYAETLKWLGGRFDPESFNPKRVRFDNPKERFELAFSEE